jgi:hypothetical protein
MKKIANIAIHKYFSPRQKELSPEEVYNRYKKQHELV